MISPYSLQGKTIVITGASSGIGRQCAIQCSQMGARVIAIGRNQQRLSEVAALLDGDGHETISYDLTDLNGIATMASQIHEKHGKVDGLIHSAGIERTAPSKLLTPEDYETLHTVNTVSGFELVRQLCQVKHFNNGGSVVLIASISGVIARRGLAAYAASKGALVSGARVLALELSKRRIRVNCVSPGTVKTPLMEKYLSTLSEADYKKRIDGFPLGLGEPSDIANACVYLLSDASKWMTGQNLIVDGGCTIR